MRNRSWSRDEENFSGGATFFQSPVRGGGLAEFQHVIDPHSKAARDHPRVDVGGPPPQFGPIGDEVCQARPAEPDRSGGAQQLGVQRWYRAAGLTT